MSSTPRFFISKSEFRGDKVTITGTDANHIYRVLRLREGDGITVCDMQKNVYDGILTFVSADCAEAALSNCRPSPAEPPYEITLYQGMPKGDKPDTIVQKAVELGVKKIGVFSSEYSSAYMNANKLERLNKVSKEAAKQCLRSVAPEVVYFDALGKALEWAKGYENKLFACEFATESKCDVGNLCGSTAMVIGSEGGFSRKEEELASELGYASVTLGKRILRAETAAVALTSVVMFHLGELK